MPTYTGSKAKTGRGTVVSIGGVTGAPGTEVWTPIEELKEASFSGSAFGTEETTNFDSGVDEEFIATTRNNGDLNLKGNLIDGAAGQVALAAACDAGVKFDFKVQLKPGPGQTTGTVYTCSGLVLSFLDIPITTKGLIEFTAKVKVSGLITKVVGS